MTNFEPVQIIQALAGSGKTELLAYRFIRLMAMKSEDGQEIDPTTILATTFSRKAAGEIRDRIVERLSEAILDTKKFDSLVLGVPEIKSQEDCVVLLKKLIKNLHRLNIGTIDSFFVKTALAFSDIIEFTQGWSILDEVHEEQVFADAVSLLTNDKSKVKQMATKLRLSKSRAKVPISKTLDGIKDDAFFDVRGSKDYVWTWGKKRKVLPQDDVKNYILKASDLDLDKISQRTALSKAVTAMQNGDWKAFLIAGMAPKIIDGSMKYSRADMDPRIEDRYAPLIEHGLAVMANRMLEKNMNTYVLMQEFFTCWMNAKHDCGLYSFDDVTYQLGDSGAMDCLDEEKLLELRFRMDATINHLLVDEFQDTSLTQWSVIEPIVQEINQSQQDRSLFFVGDVKQSLYGFRGGEPALLRGLEDELQHANTLKLDESWRCTPPILELVNTIFGKVKDAPLLTEHSPDSAEIWLKDFIPHISATPTKKKKGYAVIQTTGDHPDKTSLQLCVEKVVEEVSKIHENAPSASIGILVRSNTKQQIQRIVHALRTNKDVKKRVMAAEFGGNPLTDSPAVTIILSALLMADDCGNSAHAFHVESSPLGKYIRDVSGATIRRALLKNGYAKIINEYAEQLIEHVDKRERLRLWQLVEFAEQFASEKTLRPSDFVRIVKETQVSDPAFSQVQVMTIHKSKGLSFDAVIVCDLDNSIWKTPGTMKLHELGNPCASPIRVGMYSGDYLDEVIPEYQEMRKELHRNQVNDALCLLYVAMTRAKHALHIIVPSKSNTKNHHKKLDGLLLQILGLDQNQEPNNDLWVASGNDKTWDNAFKKKVVEKDGDKSVFSISPPSNPSLIGRGLATATPSSLEGGGKITIAERFAGDTNIAFDLGTITHKWFEDIEWLQEVPSIELLVETAPSEEAARVQASELQLSAERCINALHSDEIQQLLSLPEGTVDVYREQEFILRVSEGERFADVEMKEPTDIQGSIDRLVVYRDSSSSIIRAEIIDWKTDTVASGELEKKIKHYAPQLSSYRLAASRLLGIDREKVTTKLVFVSIGKVVDMTDKT